jgi:hypothetical protein
MIEFRMEIARNAEIPTILDVTVIAEMKVGAAGDAFVDEELSDLTRSAISDNPEPHTLLMASITGSLFTLPEGYEDLTDTIRAVVIADPDMDREHTTVYMAKLLAEKIDVLGSDDPMKSPENPYTALFVCEEHEAAPGIKLHALLPHMMAEMSVISMGKSNILFDAELPSLDDVEQSAMMSEVAKLGYEVDGSLVFRTDRVDLNKGGGDGPVLVDVISASLMSSHPTPLEYLLLDDIIDVDVLTRLLEEKSAAPEGPE